MLGAGLVIVGIILMTIGLICLVGWVNGRSERTNRIGEEMHGETRGTTLNEILRWLTELVVMYLNFFGLVIAALLAGGILIALGLGILLR